MSSDRHSCSSCSPLMAFRSHLAGLITAACCGTYTTQNYQLGLPLVSLTTDVAMPRSFSLVPTASR